MTNKSTPPPLCVSRMTLCKALSSPYGLNKVHQCSPCLLVTNPIMVVVYWEYHEINFLMMICDE